MFCTWLNLKKFLFYFYFLGRVAIGLICIGSYIVQLGWWTVQIVNSNSNWLDSVWLVWVLVSTKRNILHILNILIAS